MDEQTPTPKKKRSKNPGETVFSFRLPTSVYEQLSRLAKEQKRSVNAQMLLALEQWMEFQKPPFGD